MAEQPFIGSVFVHLSKLVSEYAAVIFIISLFCFFYASHVSPCSPLRKMLRKQEALLLWHMAKEGGVSVLLICIWNDKTPTPPQSALGCLMLLTGWEKCWGMCHLDYCSPQLHLFALKAFRSERLWPSRVWKQLSPPESLWISGVFITSLISIRGCHTRKYWKLTLTFHWR